MATLRHILCAALILLLVLNSTHALSLSYYPTQLNSTQLRSLSLTTHNSTTSQRTHTHTQAMSFAHALSMEATRMPIPFPPYPTHHTPQPTSIRSCLVYACLCVCLLRLPFHLTATPCLRSLQPALTLCLSPTLPLSHSPTLSLACTVCLLSVRLHCS